MFHMIKKANYDFFVKINNFLLNLKYYKFEKYHNKQTKIIYREHVSY